MAEIRENMIEWVNGQNTIACTFNQRKFITKVKKLKERFPNEVDFIENEDGSIFAHLPLKSLKLSIITREGATNEDITEDEEEGEEEC